MVQGMEKFVAKCGLQDKQPETVPLDRIRKPGAGRRRLTEKDPTLQADLEALINPVTRGSRIGTPVDQQEYSEVGSGTPRARPYDQCPQGG